MSQRVIVNPESGNDDISVAFHQKLNSIAFRATNPVRANVSGVADILVGSNLNQLGTSDEVTFKIDSNTTITAANVHALKNRRKSDGNYKINLNGNQVSGTLSNFIEAGGESTTEFGSVLTEINAAKIKVSDHTLENGDITRLNNLFSRAKGEVEVKITDGGASSINGTYDGSSYTGIDTSNSNSVTHKATIVFGTQNDTANRKFSLEKLAADSGVTKIIGTYNAISRANVESLSTDLTSNNNTTR